MSDIRLAPTPLQALVEAIFTAAGLPPKDAATEAEVLVWANLRGVDSHGVQRVAEYLNAVDKGLMNPNPNIKITRQTPATLLIDADRAFGPVVTTFAMEEALSKASQVGIGWALIRNTTHQGAMAYYTHMATERDMVGLAIVCSPPNMAPTGARAPGVHNSPIAVAVPGNKRPPISLDIATSVAAGGKLQVAIDKRSTIPPEWALDADGNPTTDPKQAASLRPVGAYKGYGLALIFECLTSLMVANPLLSGRLLQQDPVPNGTQNSLVAAIDINTFSDPDDYKNNVDKLDQGLKALPKAPDADHIYLPGDLENITAKERRQEGIPLPVGTVEKLRAAAERFNLALPAGL